jgi:hypothetical protein
MTSFLTHFHSTQHRSRLPEQQRVSPRPDDFVLPIMTAGAATPQSLQMSTSFVPWTPARGVPASNREDEVNCRTVPGKISIFGAACARSMGQSVAPDVRRKYSNEFCGVAK